MADEPDSPPEDLVSEADGAAAGADEAAVDPELAAPAPDEDEGSLPESAAVEVEFIEPVVATPREKPAVPGADLEVDIVPEGVDPLAAEPPYSYAYAEDEADEVVEVEEPLDAVVAVEPIEAVAIDLAAGARYRATGTRKTAIARVTLRPGTGSYKINGRTLEAFFPRDTLQRNIRQPLETVGYEERMDVVARMHGGGVSSQAGALRHGISRALLEADPSLRGELKRRGFLTRDARAKERKKAGLKKARKRPQFSKR
jgi:small subunit ribosomal protein S9